MLAPLGRAVISLTRTINSLAVEWVWFWRRREGVTRSAREEELELPLFPRLPLAGTWFCFGSPKFRPVPARVEAVPRVW